MLHSVTYSMEDRNRELTKLLNEMIGGDQESAEIAISLVYGRLRELAQTLLYGESGGASMDATELLHEAFLSKLRAIRKPVDSRRHFYGLAARAMRQVLVDRSRHVSAQKRDSSSSFMAPVPRSLSPETVVSIHAGLDELERIDPNAAEVVYLHCFLGSSLEEVSTTTGRTLHDARTDWRFAIQWLEKRI